MSFSPPQILPTIFQKLDSPEAEAKKKSSIKFILLHVRIVVVLVLYLVDD